MLAMLLLERVVLEYNERVLVLLTVRCTSAMEALYASLPSRVILVHAPLDAPGPVRRFLDHWRPTACVMASTSLAFNMILMSKQAGIPMALLDASIPTETFLSWHSNPLRRTLFSAMARSFDIIVPHSDAEVGRFRLFGAHLDHMPGWCSDLLYACVLSAPVSALWRPAQRDATRMERLLQGRVAWIAAGLTEKEGEDMREVHTALKAECEHVLTVLVPTSPATGPALAQAFCDDGIPAVAASTCPSSLDDVEVFVADLPWETPLLLSVVEVAYFGGLELPGDGNYFRLAEAAVASCAVVANASVPTHASLASELNVAAFTAAEDTANAVRTTGVEHDDAVPSTTMLVDPLAHSTTADARPMSPQVGSPRTVDSPLAYASAGRAASGPFASPRGAPATYSDVVADVRSPSFRQRGARLVHEAAAQAGLSPNTRCALLERLGAESSDLFLDGTPRAESPRAGEMATGHTGRFALAGLPFSPGSRSTRVTAAAGARSPRAGDAPHAGANLGYGLTNTGQWGSPSSAASTPSSLHVAVFHAVGESRQRQAQSQQLALTDSMGWSASAATAGRTNGSRRAPSAAAGIAARGRDGSCEVTAQGPERSASTKHAADAAARPISPRGSASLSELAARTSVTPRCFAPPLGLKRIRTRAKADKLGGEAEKLPSPGPLKSPTSASVSELAVVPVTHASAAPQVPAHEAAHEANYSRASLDTAPVTPLSDFTDMWAGASPFIGVRGTGFASLKEPAASVDASLPEISVEATTRGGPTAAVASLYGDEEASATGRCQLDNTRVTMRRAWLRHGNKTLLSAMYLPQHPMGPAVLLVNDKDSLLEGIQGLLREPIMRSSRGNAAGQSTAQLASGLVATVWDVLDNRLLEPALLKYEAQHAARTQP